MAQKSILKLSEVNKEKRIDAEFYKKEFLDNEELIIKKKWKILKDLSTKITDGSHITPNYTDEGIPFLMVRNIGIFDINFEDVKFIDKKFDGILKGCKPKENDILLSKVGTLGRVALVPKDKDFNIFVSLAVLKGIKDINIYYLTIFLLTRNAYLQYQRYAKGISQPDLHLEDIRKIKVPIPSESFQKEIENLYIASEKNKEKANKLYLEAENLLLKELGVINFKLGFKKTFIAKYSDYLASNRFDADYFQPKYNKLIQEIESYDGGFDLLGNIIELTEKNFKPEKESMYHYIELANIMEKGDIEGFMEEYGENLPSRAGIKVKTNDVLVSSIEGSMSSCALITKEYGGALCSTGFYTIHSETINPETLLILFKSKIIQELLMRGCSGTILMAINGGELKKIKIPKIKESCQKLIAEKIKEVYILRKERKEWLEKAKNEIEDYILK